MARPHLFFFLLIGFSAALPKEEMQSDPKREKRFSFSKRPSKIKSLTIHYHDDIVDPIEDGCDQDEVKYAGDGECYKLLTKGPCSIDEFIVLNRTNDAGVCVPRLCSPDRIFVPDFNLCFDYNDESLCPPDREARITAYGDPICECKFGTFDFQSNDKQGEESTCASILTRTSKCPDEQVLWFTDLSQTLECQPDPCGGENLRRGQHDMPSIPLKDGRCFQIGSDNICPPLKWYSLDLMSKEGECAGLEELGYEILDEKEYSALTATFGPPISRSFFSIESLIYAEGNFDIAIDVNSNISVFERNPFLPPELNSTEFPETSAEGINAIHYQPLEVTTQASKSKKDRNHISVLKTEEILSRTFSLPYNSANGNTDDFFQQVSALLQKGATHYRNQRQSDGTALSSRLCSCANASGGKRLTSTSRPPNNSAAPTQARSAGGLGK